MNGESVVGFRLSPQQAQVWLLQQDGSRFASRCAVHCEGPLDAERLKAAVRGVAARHEILRTNFRRQPGMNVPFQVIREDPTFGWETIELASLNPSEQLPRVDETLNAARAPRDLAQDALLECSLLSLAEQSHLLVLRLPALVADARSMQELAREICEAYGGAPGTDVLQYPDYAEWQHELAESEDQDAVLGREFWQTQMSVPPTVLPLELRAGAGVAFEPEHVVRTLDTAQSGRVRELRDAPPHLLACLHALVHRLSGQPDIRITAVLDGRTQDELTNGIGLFARTLPLQVHFEPDLMFETLVEAVRFGLEQAAQWQDYFPSGTTTNPVAQAPLFEFQPLIVLPTVQGVTFSIRSCTSDLERDTLKLVVQSDIEGYTLVWRYDPRRLEQDEVERIADEYLVLLGATLANPTLRVRDLPLLGKTERNRLLVEFNRTIDDSTVSRDATIASLFEQQAARTPEHTAVVYEDRQYTYAELNASANRLARALQRRGVGPGATVGLLVNRSAEMIVALLAILKAGGAYVPLNSEHPNARLAFQLNETHAPVLVTEEGLLSHVPEYAGATLCIDRDVQEFAGEAESNLRAANAPENPVYVMYTSGSTGTPKGVAVTHRNLVNYTRFMMQRLRIRSVESGETGEREGLSFATVSTITADLGNTCIFPSLLSGGTLHIISHARVTDGALWAEYTAAHPIDVLKITPSHLSALMTSQDAAPLLPRRYLILGGELASWQLVDRVLHSAQCTVLNHYGPTETTVGALTYTVTRDATARRWSASVPIGRPIANTRVYILDTGLNPVPIGAVGELYIGGEGVARGYLNQPERTAESFVSDPFEGDGTARMYKTGDRARWLPDGNIEYLGRVDDQVKIRGFRVEPGEIECVLKEHPGVRQAAVLAHADAAGNLRLTGYVGGEGTSAGELIHFLAQRLPEYMVPPTLIVQSVLPLNANGKVDRTALAALGVGGGAHDSTGEWGDFVAPQTPLEAQIAAIWIQVLGVERVSVNDNFFDLGGHSLLTTQVIARLRRDFGVALPLNMLFEKPTIQELAQELAAQIVHPLEEQFASEGSTDELESLLSELDGMTEQEAEQLLAGRLNEETVERGGNSYG